MRYPDYRASFASVGGSPLVLDAAWQEIAATLAAEVLRLHDEIDRLNGGGDAKAPLSSHADEGHPLWPLWVGLHLDELDRLGKVWRGVLDGWCPRCGLELVPGPYPPFQMCEDDNLCFIASDGHFALDEIDRARDRGPDS